MRVVLCEKPSQGKDIARVLGAHRREAGCLGGPGITVTRGSGHLIEAAPPEAYGEHFQRWTLETLPIVPRGGSGSSRHAAPRSSRSSNGCSARPPSSSSPPTPIAKAR